MCTRMSNCPVAERYHTGPPHEPDYTGSVLVGLRCVVVVQITQKAYGTTRNAHQQHHMPRVTWCIVHDTGCLAHGVICQQCMAHCAWCKTLWSVRWCAVHGARCIKHDAWGMGPGAWCMGGDAWGMGPGAWCMVLLGARWCQTGTLQGQTCLICSAEWLQTQAV